MREAVGHEAPDARQSDPRAPWKTPVVITSEIQDTEFKGTSVGDFTSSGRPYGS
jgi:hypothetical protein